MRGFPFPYLEGNSLNHLEGLRVSHRDSPAPCGKRHQRHPDEGLAEGDPARRQQTEAKPGKVTGRRAVAQ